MTARACPRGDFRKLSPTKTSEFLVFSSVGDSTNVDRWLKGRNFDLWIVYYGDDPSTDYSHDCEYFVRRKGAKFPNFQAAFIEHRDLLARYEAIMVADDDLIMSGRAINELFAIRRRYDLWLLQPSFDMQSRISHPITRKRPWSLLRYTNFVEVTCPLFETSRLMQFMDVYDDRLVGWGIDWWYSHLIHQADEQSNKIAIVDTVSCRNPRESTKPRGREIDRLQSKTLRQHYWSVVKRQHALEIDERAMQFAQIPNRQLSRQALHAFLYLRHLVNKRVLRLRSLVANWRTMVGKSSG